MALAVVAVPLLPRLLPVDDTDVPAADAARPGAGLGRRRPLGLRRDRRVGAAAGRRRPRRRRRAARRHDPAARVVAGRGRLARRPAAGLGRARPRPRRGQVTIAYDYEDAARRRHPSTPRSGCRAPPTCCRRPWPAPPSRTPRDADVRRLDPRRVAGDRRRRPALHPARRPHDGRPGRRVGRPRLGAAAARRGARGRAPTRPTSSRRSRRSRSSAPPTSACGFQPSGDVEVERADTLDIADAAGRYAPFLVPQRLAGLERRTERRGGRGLRRRRDPLHRRAPAPPRGRPAARAAAPPPPGRCSTSAAPSPPTAPSRCCSPAATATTTGPPGWSPAP